MRWSVRRPRADHSKGEMAVLITADEVAPVPITAGDMTTLPITVGNVTTVQIMAGNVGTRRQCLSCAEKYREA